MSLAAGNGVWAVPMESVAGLCRREPVRGALEPRQRGGNICAGGLFEERVRRDRMPRLAVRKSQIARNPHANRRIGKLRARGKASKRYPRMGRADPLARARARARTSDTRPLPSLGSAPRRARARRTSRMQRRRFPLLDAVQRALVVVIAALALTGGFVHRGSSVKITLTTVDPAAISLFALYVIRKRLSGFSFRSCSECSLRRRPVVISRSGLWPRSPSS